MLRFTRIAALLSFALVVLSLSSFAGDNGIHFPTKVVPTPMPPTPVPPVVIDQVKHGEWYIIGMPAEYVWTSEPAGIVEVKSKPTGITIAGKFADGTGVDEERAFKDPFIYHVKPVAGKSGKVTLFGFVKGKPITSTEDMIKQSLTVGEVEPTPPVPDPDKPKGKGAWVIGIASDTAPSIAVTQVLDCQLMRDLKAAGKCRVYHSVNDADQITAKGYDALMKEAKVTAPALIVLDKSGNKVLAITLPADEASLAAALKGVIAP